MKSILASLAVVVVGLWSGATAALGLGEIELRSRLNQRFDAVIPLHSLSTDEAAGLRVGLASVDDFARAGMLRADALADLRFAFVTGGRPRIEISSTQIEREPYLQLLLEIRVNGNRVLRQYTVLLDPPDRARPPPASDDSQDQPFEEVHRVAPVAAAVTAAPPRRGVAAGAAAAAAGSLYGPVKSSETLWSIATQVRGERDLSMDQVLLAIYTSNPRAFDGGIGGLQRGAMLRLPSTDEMAAVSVEQAHAAVGRLRAAPASGAAAVSTPRPKSPPRLEPAHILPPPPAGSLAAPPPAADAPPDNSAAEPSAPSAATAVTAMPDPATQTTGTQPASEDAGGQAEAAPAAGAEVADETTPPAAEPADRSAAAAPAPSSRPAPADAEDGLLKALLIPLILGLLLGLAVLFRRWQARRGAAIELGGREPPAPSGPTRGMAVAAGAGGAVAAAFRHAPGAVGDGAAEQPLAVEITPDPEVVHVVVSPAPPIETPAAAPPAEFDLSQPFADQTLRLDLDSSDPLTGADFHLAYGLHEEAALLLQQAAAKYPERTDIVVKLAETYYAAGSTAEFEQTAAALKPRLSPEQWQQIAEMGRRLDPGATLFAAAAAPRTPQPEFDREAPLASGSAASRLQTSVTQFDLPPLTEPGMADAEAAAFNPDQQALPMLPDTAAASAAAPAQDGFLDFDVGMPAAASRFPDNAPASTAHAPEFSIDFDLEGMAPVASARTQNSIPLEDFDFGADPSSNDGSSAGEAGTKLDLARVYAEMGDYAMARSMIAEVLEQGSEQQKQDARALAERLP